MKRKLFLLSFLVCFIYQLSRSQSTGINTLNPNINAALDIQATSGKNQGLLIPRLKASGKGSFGFGLAEQGLLFYGNDTDSIYYWTGVKWITLQPTGGSVNGPWKKSGTNIELSTLADNVGIGVTPGGTKLEIRGVDATATNLALRITNTTPKVLMQISNAGEIVFPPLVGKGVVVANPSGILSVKKGNPITGLGTPGKVAFWNTTDSLSANTNFHWDNTNSRLGIGTSAPTQALSIGEKFLVNGTNGVVSFTDPVGGIQFPAITGASTAMINMFASGTNNADRLVIGHSSSFQDFGLLYSDAADYWHWVWAGGKKITFTATGIGINNPTPLYALDVSGKFRLQDGSEGNGFVLTSDANGLASWKDISPKVGFKVTSTLGQSIPNGTTQLLYNAVVFNDGGGFSGNQFVAPSDGVYHFESAALYNSLSTATLVGMLLYLNGTTVSGTFNSADVNFYTPTINATLKLAKGDIITTRIFNGTAATQDLNVLASYNYFSGFKVY